MADVDMQQIFSFSNKQFEKLKLSVFV